MSTPSPETSTSLFDLEKDFPPLAAAISIKNVSTKSDPVISSMAANGIQQFPICVSLDGPPDPQTLRLEHKVRWNTSSWFRTWQPGWGEVEPRIQDIRAVVTPYVRILGLDLDNFDIAFFAQGSWNKAYTLTSKDVITGEVRELIFRVPTPVYPWYKLQSEVATMEYVRLHTSISVPKVYAFDSNMDNALGFEWIIMEKVEGGPYRHASESMTQLQKENAHSTLAEWVDQLARLQFDHIGSIYRQWDSSKPDYLEFSLGPISNGWVYSPWRHESQVSRGPFKNEIQYLAAILEMNRQDVLDTRHVQLAREAFAVRERKKNEPESDDDDSDDDGYLFPQNQAPATIYREGAFGPDGVQKACRIIAEVLPLMECELAEQSPRKYVLYHHDISMDNVLINAKGNATALLDWENLFTRALTQVQPWPNMIDPDECSAPDPESAKFAKRSKEFFEAHQAAHLNARLGETFMRRLKQLDSPWPQREGKNGIQIVFDNEFEEDLAELEMLVKQVYTKWESESHMGICEEITTRYGDGERIQRSERRQRLQAQHWSWI